MSEKFSDNITKIVVDYATRLQETEEEFIYQSISPFCCNVLQRKISKKELEEKLVRAERMKWIPCNEKMPEDNTDVIVCFYSGIVTEMRYWENGNFQGIYEHTTKSIVAWMPLPKPYKESN